MYHLSEPPAMIHLIEEGYLEIDRMVEREGDQPGGPVTLKADYIYACLIGLENEVIDQIRIKEVLPEIYLPISLGTRLDVEWPPNPIIPKNRYLLMSHYATAKLEKHLVLNNVSNNDNFMVTLAMLR